MNKSFISLLYLLLLFSTPSIAQETEMADTMRSNGKIYVVIAVIITILAGIILYLIRIDRKISRIERSHRS